MPLVNEQIAVADATAGTNLASGKWWEFSQKFRYIAEIALVGGNAILEPVLEVFYGQTKVAEITNTTAGAVAPLREDIQDFPDDLVMMPNEPLQIRVKTAPTVTAIALKIKILEIDPSSLGV